jgi:outer membrane protein OmpA-like peptidoglycan-associated protein/tetratricopeptide (TPR) repeat protein
MKNRLALFLFIMGFNFFCISNVQAQNNSAAQKLFEKAVAAIDNHEYPEAVEFLNESIQKDSNYIDSYITLFQVYVDLKKNENAIAIFEKAISIDSASCAPYFVKYANTYASLGNYKKANDLLNTIKEGLPVYLTQSFNQLKTICDFALSYPMDENSKVINAGDSINTANAEYFPTVTVQDSLLIFMRKDGILREDFFYSIISPNNTSIAQPLSDSLNLAAKKGAPSLSSDLNTLYYSAEYNENGYGRYDIYKVTKSKTGWSLPKNLGQNINTDWWESAPSISPDGQALYFSSNKPGGYGGIDIYVSYKNERGGWKQAVNLGAAINTAGDEQTPFIHADNKTLYFSSTGWPGFGGADLFVTYKKVNGSWAKPINLGYPINTNENEQSVAISSNGKEGYIASDRPDSRGGLDIYKISLPDFARANKTLYFNGYINDAITKKSLTGTVKLVDPSDANKFMTINVDSTGYFVLSLPYFDSLGIQVNSPQHEYASILINKKYLDSIKGSTIPFNLNPIVNQFTKNFNNVFFETNAATLLSNSNVELNALVNYLQASPKATILIEGHTDNTGLAANNLLLSSKRAESIAQYLMNKGILSSRITTKGLGDSKPIADNNTEKGRAQNRRTSFTITL